MRTSVPVIVTPNDISLGLRGSHNGCALYRAIRRATGGNDTVSVAAGTVSVVSDQGPCEGKRITATLPDEAWEFQQRYDHHKTVDPIAFELEFEPC